MPSNAHLNALPARTKEERTFMRADLKPIKDPFTVVLSCGHTTEVSSRFLEAAMNCNVPPVCWCRDDDRYRNLEYVEAMPC